MNELAEIKCHDKFCRRCEVYKPLNQFNRDNSKPDGRCLYCKQCYRGLLRVSREHIQEYEKIKYYEKAKKVRRCRHKGCEKVLSIYNRERICFSHQRERNLKDCV